MGGKQSFAAPGRHPKPFTKAVIHPIVIIRLAARPKPVFVATCRIVSFNKPPGACACQRAPAVRAITLASYAQPAEKPEEKQQSKTCGGEC